MAKAKLKKKCDYRIRLDITPEEGDRLVEVLLFADDLDNLYYILDETMAEYHDKEASE